MVRRRKKPVDTNKPEKIREDPVEQQISENQAHQPAGQDTAGEHTEATEDASQEVAGLRQEVESLRDKHLRAVADYQNLEKRTATRQAEAVRHGQADLVKAVLVVLDDFERTIEGAASATEPSAVTDGVRIVYEHLSMILGQFGVEQLAVGRGDPFDPLCQEAVAQVASDEIEPGHVLEVVQIGYKMRDRVLRPTKVVVAAEPASQEEGPEQQEEAEDSD